MASNKFMSAISSRALQHSCQQQMFRNSCQNSSFSRRFSDVVRPTRSVSAQERIALRAARKERAAKVLGTGTAAAAGGRGFVGNKYFWYASVIIPSGILVWGLSDENSPPAQFCELIGLTGFLQKYIDGIAKPSHEKLLPDWSQVCVFCHFISLVLSGWMLVIRGMMYCQT